jgi:cytochrome c peroxidase
MSRFRMTVCIVSSIFALTLINEALAAGPQLTLKQRLGQFLFMDTSLSSPAGQACVTCHHRSAGFADPENKWDPYNKVVSEGVVAGKFGGRNAPTAAYASFSPPFSLLFDDEEQSYFPMGGQFWDGRASTLKDQAKAPFLNPVEMHNTKNGVVRAVRRAPYAWLFLLVFGPTSLNNVEQAYDKIAEAIADFESSKVLNRFSSKYDRYVAGQAQLTQKELWGLQLFNDPSKGNCAACHPSTPDPAMDPDHALFTDFSYDNLGIPKSTNPLIADNPIDYGLGTRPDVIAVTGDGEVIDGVTVSLSQAGKFKVSTLRNIAKTPPYGHNGYFATLTDIVNFYNTAGIPGMWPDPEVNMDTVNRSELGNLGLSTAEVDAIVAFLKTLSDGYGGHHGGWR